MSRFISQPNLPKDKVTSLICGGLNKYLTDYYKSRGIDIFYTENNPFVDKAVSSHCDIEALYLGDGRIIINPYQKRLSDKLTEKGFNVIFSSKEIKGDYPNDVILNNTLVGKYLIGNEKFFDASVRENTGDKIILNAKQGYSKCSVLVVNENSIITDDPSIASVSSKNGISCLLISKGDILLDGHEYGFIGGASGKLSENEIVFFGDITGHRDYLKIKHFIEERNIEIISFDFKLTDFGGIIPLEELE